MHHGPLLQVAEATDEKKDPASGIKEVKKVPKPDEAAHREALAAEDDKLAAKNDRLAAIKATLEQREGSRSDNTEFALAKQKYNEARMEGRRAHTVCCRAHLAQPILPERCPCTLWRPAPTPCGGGDVRKDGVRDWQGGMLLRGTGRVS